MYVVGGESSSLNNIVIYGAEIPQIYSFCAKKLAKTVLPRIFAAKLQVYSKLNFLFLSLIINRKKNKE